VLGLLVEQLHVVEGGADVLARLVLAVQGLDEAAHGAHEAFRLLRLRIADDDGLAAAEVDARGGVLVGHAAAQTQRVHDRLLLRGIRPHSEAAAGGAEGGGVNGDHRLEPDVGVVAEHDLAEIVLGEVLEDHAAVQPPSTMSRWPVT
jgi:hypothetical protein